MKKLILVLLVSFAFGRGRPQADPRLKDVHSIFISGNNQVADQVRSEMRKDAEKGKGCIVYATNPKQADAVLEVVADSNSQGILGDRNWSASANLTLKSGDMIWSQSSRGEDAPFSSGGKDAGKAIYHFLKYDACGKS